jgi:hypothetical protein
MKVPSLPRDPYCLDGKGSFAKMSRRVSFGNESRTLTVSAGASTDAFPRWSFKWSRVAPLLLLRFLVMIPSYLRTIYGNSLISLSDYKYLYHSVNEARLHRFISVQGRKLATSLELDLDSNPHPTVIPLRYKAAAAGM